MRKSAWIAGALASVWGMAWAAGAHAEDKWWPAKVYDFDSGSKKVVEYTPLEKAAKPWNICVLFPHMKDTFWVAVDYGIVEEAKRMGVNMTLYQAGGYENLPKQLVAVRRLHGRQFRRDHRRPDLRGGHGQEVRRRRKAGKPVISTVNPVAKATVTSQDVRRLHDDGRADRQVSRRLPEGQAGERRELPRPGRLRLGRAFNDGFKKAIKCDST